MTTRFISTTSRQFSSGNFVTEGTTEKVGVTLDIFDTAQDNPLVQVRWVGDLSVEWLRAEYLTVQS